MDNIKHLNSNPNVTFKTIGNTKYKTVKGEFGNKTYRLDGVTNKNFLVDALPIGTLTDHGKVVKIQWTQIQTDFDNDCQ